MISKPHDHLFQYCFLFLFVSSSLPRLTYGLSQNFPEWTDAAVRTAQELTLQHKAKLLESGTDPTKSRQFAISAEALNAASSPEFWMRSFDAVEKEGSKTITKILHFQRQGQGTHNVLGDEMLEKTGTEPDIRSDDPELNPWIRPELIDPPLTEQGKEECALRKRDVSIMNPELIIVSPLQRTIQTASITFSDPHVAKIPLVAHEGCREELGVLTCNKRRNLSEIKQDFPMVDFSYIDTEEDTLWKSDKRESVNEISFRIYNFLVDFVMNRPEPEIAIVGHCAWLFNMCNTVIDCQSSTNLQKWFGPSEIRSMRVTFTEQKPRTKEQSVLNFLKN